jgi:hypothetical protein
MRQWIKDRFILNVQMIILVNPVFYSPLPEVKKKRGQFFGRNLSYLFLMKF